MKGRRRGPAIPSFLREEAAQYGNDGVTATGAQESIMTQQSSYNKKRKNGSLSRKDARKAERTAKKQRRAEYASRKHVQPQPQQAQPSKKRQNQSNSVIKKNQLKNISLSMDDVHFTAPSNSNQKRISNDNRKHSNSNKPSKQSSSTLSSSTRHGKNANFYSLLDEHKLLDSVLPDTSDMSDVEDEEIRYLESKLGIRKKSSTKTVKIQDDDKAKKALKRLEKEYRRDGFDQDLISFLSDIDGLSKSLSKKKNKKNVSFDQEDEYSTGSDMESDSVSDLNSLDTETETDVDDEAIDDDEQDIDNVDEQDVDDEEEEEVESIDDDDDDDDDETFNAGNNLKDEMKTRKNKKSKKLNNERNVHDLADETNSEQKEAIDQMKKSGDSLDAVDPSESDVTSETSSSEDEETTLLKDAQARRRRKYQLLYGSSGPAEAHTELGISQAQLDEKRRNSKQKEVDEAEHANKLASSSSLSVLLKKKETRSADSNQSADIKYIPPALRKQMAQQSADGTEQDELTLRLMRRVKGLFNRLAETNVEPLAKEIAVLYASHSKGRMNGIMSACLLETCANPTKVLKQLIMVYAALTSALHIFIGVSVGAHVLEKLVLRFQQILQLPEKLVSQSTEQEMLTMENSVSDELLIETEKVKEASNIAQFISYLYIFNVTSSHLVIDLLHLLTNRFSESDIELLVVLLKHVGWQLRSDDPAGLRDVIASIQNKTNRLGIDGNSETTTNASISMRVQVMLEMLLDIKNNRKRQSQDQLLERGVGMRKWLSKLATKKAADQGDRRIRAQWNDYMSIEKRGRWWLVGGAWSGRDSTSKQSSDTIDQSQAGNNSELVGGLTIRHEEAKLLELARKQRMNTAVRRSIFVALMGASGIDSALERLLKLNLKGSAEREIVRVIIDCCAQETAYNPYYSTVAKKLCDIRPSVKFTFQLALWDFIKQLDQQETRQIYNTARLMAHLISHFSLGISCLKVFDMTKLTQKALLFVRACIGAILLSCNDDSVLAAVFTRCGKGPDKNLVRDGIAFFLVKFMKAHIETTYANNKTKRHVLKSRLKLARKALDSIPISGTEISEF